MKDSLKRPVLHLTLIGCAFVLFVVPEVSAQGSAQKYKIDGIRPEVHGTLGWGFGVGGRIDIPIVPKGFLNSRQDELVLSPGLDFFFFDLNHDGCRADGRDVRCNDYGHGAGFVLSTPVVAQWNIYVADWSFFPEAGFAISFGDNFMHHHHYHDNDFDDHIHVNVDFVLGGGARWHFSARNALVFRLAWPYGMQIGVTF